ncbi:MAG: hypothetical protein ACFFDN_16720 [Candidatus Hodarchaeota archaeon]
MNINKFNMECTYCGKILGDNEGLIFREKYFYSNKCKKIYDYYYLGDKMLKYCDTYGNHCGICPIDRECSFFLKIEKQINSNEDILEFEIPIIS